MYMHKFKREKKVKMLVEFDKILNAGNNEANLCKIYLYARKLRGEIDAK